MKLKCIVDRDRGFNWHRFDSQAAQAAAEGRQAVLGTQVAEFHVAACFSALIKERNSPVSALRLSSLSHLSSLWWKEKSGLASHDSSNFKASHICQLKRVFYLFSSSTQTFSTSFTLQRGGFSSSLRFRHSSLTDNVYCASSSSAPSCAFRARSRSPYDPHRRTTDDDQPSRFHRSHTHTYYLIHVHEGITHHVLRQRRLRGLRLQQ